MYGRWKAIAFASIALAGVAAAQAPQPAAPELSEQQRLRSFSPGGPLTANVEQPRWTSPRNPLDSSSPVTDALLASPPPGDWLSWRRTLDDQGFSPLASIDKKNVGRLQLEWSLALPPGPNASTPLVHDGVLYVHSFGDNVQALDAATGDELWHYDISEVELMPTRWPEDSDKEVEYTLDNYYPPAFADGRLYGRPSVADLPDVMGPIEPICG